MPTFALSRDFLLESQKRDGEREQPDGSNSGPYVCRVLAKTTYRRCGAPWCAGHVTDVVDTVLVRNGGEGTPCDSAAVETWDTDLARRGWLWKGSPTDLPLGAIICQGGRHITFFAGWAGTAPSSFRAGAAYFGHGGNQGNAVRRSQYAWTTDTRAYVIPDGFDKERKIVRPRPLREVITGEGENRKVVFHGRHVPTLLNRVRKAIGAGAKKVVIRTVPDREKA